MKASMVTVVGLVIVIFAFGMGQAGAQHRGGKGKPAAAHSPKAKGGARPGAGKAHTPKPKGKVQQKAKGGMAKPAQKQEKPKESAKAKHDEKKKHIAKEKTKAEKHAKRAEKKAPAKVAARGGTDHESISLLRAVHHKLHEADHDYDGHRHRALEHVGSALGHLGSSPEAPNRSGPGHRNSPQSVSDAIMRETRASLEMIKGRFAVGTGVAKGHSEARGAVDAAIREIGLALAVR